MKQKHILYILLVGLFSALGCAHAVEPGWYSKASRADFMLRENLPLPMGRYTGNGINLKFSPFLLDPKQRSMLISIPPGTVLEDVTLDFSGKTVFNLQKCTLRRVAIKVSASSVVNLEGCALEDCYVTFNTNGYQRANGNNYTLEEVYAEIGRPQLNLTDCVVAGSTLDSPYRTGLTATRCSFTTCSLEAGQEDGKQKTSRYVQCVFIGSKLANTDVLLTTSLCRFNECECPDVLAPDAGSHVVSPVQLQLAWENGKPALPPNTANGKVSFGLLTPAPAAGSSLAHQWDGSHLTVTDLPVANDGVIQPLQQAWKLMDINTYVNLAKNGSANVPATQPAAGAKPIATSANAVITGTAAAAGVAFQSRINQVNGLLISQLSSGGEAGQVTRMSLTALPSLGESPSTLKFNQDVGESMGKALNEVSKFSQLRHGGWPVGHSLEIGFEDKYIGKDGPSAAVACALLLEAAITGKKWDPAFAVTGDMNADGSVQPIGGVQAKIRGATKGSCKLIGVPVKNEKSVQDLLVLEGPAPLVGITVFGIKTFDDALLLAGTERPQALQTALTNFDAMRAVMLRDPRQIVPLLPTPHAAQRLQALLTAAPNCYSAKYLLLYLQGRGPRTLSIGGSIEAAQSSADSIVSSIDHDVDTNMSSLKGDELGTSLYRLRNLRPRLDQRVWPYVDNLVAYGEVIRGALLNPVRSGARYVDLVSKANKAAGGAKAAYDKLINDVDVREELGL
ncbi:MAG: hypothetical protein K9N47_03590 [Prosthecobacter sp.]|uniref:S16 family serine protease n=1 Tax=Prosthecobacter sp. TaxID=1965333 RepID=UPI0025F32653|nr:S16 family serine protease [Prosthecobacter sp.]MCF7785177.1 hypothetical protein [Prosthecobacter sp.]